MIRMCTVGRTRTIRRMPGGERVFVVGIELVRRLLEKYIVPQLGPMQRCGSSRYASQNPSYHFLASGVGPLGGLQYDILS